jgi:hypothetical protein
MSKGMRRLSCLALLLWLGCGEASSESSDTGEAETPIAPAATSTAAAGPSKEAAVSVGTSAGARPATTPGVSAPATGAAPGAPGAGSSSAMTAASAPTTPSAGAATPPGAASSADGAAKPAASSSGSAGAGAPAMTPPPAGEEVGQIQPSQLTAGTWDDNRNFQRFEKYRKTLKDKQLSGLMPSTDAEHLDAQKAFSQPAPREKLDVSLVIDTTGSMGDEISYLQSEFLALSAAIEDKYPDAEQRWSLVLYRDKGDEYVTRWFEFSDNVMEFRDKLGEQSANGGGDFPEAPDAAIKAMSELQWRSEENVARLAFWVADAPHHDSNAAAMLDAIHAARELGVHLYPVASSGVDELTEITMRSGAQLTGGRYLFLTDDSGIGGPHKEPTIPCYFVTKLNKAILRMVSIEMSGAYSEPAEDDIIRTGGDPKDGSCKLESGEVVEVY